MITLESKHVAIIGAGTMGAGIAQVAAQAGWTVHLKDIDEATVRNAIAGIVKRFDRLVEKERMTPVERDAAAARLLCATESTDLEDCKLLIEVVVENLDVKSNVLAELIPALPKHAIIASNTSSLSISELGERIGESQRTIGMHFFNPAPLMQLVEVIAGRSTKSGVVDQICEIAQRWGKHVARAADVPGFIVNHVARPYYLEAFRILEDGYADPPTIDSAMKTIGGFRMGPFELTDLIGHDVNTKTTREVWEGIGKPALLRPSMRQEQLVTDGHLGRKSGRGVYDYSSSDKENPTPAIETEIRRFDPPQELRVALHHFVQRATDKPSENELHNYIFARILIAIFTQATTAHERGIATKQDIDTAMRFGVNYPRGPFDWSSAIGDEVIKALAAALNDHVGERRFAV